MSGIGMNDTEIKQGATGPVPATKQAEGSLTVLGQLLEMVL